MNVSKISSISYKNTSAFNNFKLTPAAEAPPAKKSNKDTVIISGAVILAAIAAALITRRLSKKPINVIQKAEEKIMTYHDKLAEGVSNMLNKKVEAESLSSVLNKEQFLKEITSLTRENYHFSIENTSSFGFIADLHSHSHYSDGKIPVKELLDEVAIYSDKVHEKTGKKFLFALTDHDSIDGVKEALGIIAQNPQKFKHVNFVTGSELSFVEKSDASANPCEIYEVLAYCFNPFLQSTEQFFKNIKLKRQMLIAKFIDTLNENFRSVNYCYDEFISVYRPAGKNENYMFNLHWKLMHYGQTKKAVYDLAKNRGINADAFYASIMDSAGKDNSLWGLKKRNLIPDSIQENSLINELDKVHFKPRGEEKLFAPGENTFEEIIGTFSQDKETVLGFAHPFYMTEKRYDVKSFTEELIQKSKGLMQLTESQHQAYQPNIAKEGIENINRICENHGLQYIGGTDNHKENWMIV